MHSEKIRVAVYGTLKQNQSNHWLLADQKRCGEFQCDLITLYDLGPFPAAKLSNSDGARVEVYEVDDETFARLDELEGFNAESEAGILLLNFSASNSISYGTISLSSPVSFS